MNPKSILTLQECRKRLGSKFEKYTDGELVLVMDFLQELAEIVVDQLLRERDDSFETEQIPEIC